jgi:hypothetical protein
MRRLADVQNPSETNGFDNTAVVETFDPEAEGETSPGADAIPGPFPEKNGNAAPGNSSYDACKNKHAAKGL